MRFGCPPLSHNGTSATKGSGKVVVEPTKIIEVNTFEKLTLHASWADDYTVSYISIEDVVETDHQVSVILLEEIPDLHDDLYIRLYKLSLHSMMWPRSDQSVEKRDSSYAKGEAAWMRQTLARNPNGTVELDERREKTERSQGVEGEQP
jgi:hypothetical protein